MEWNIRPLDGIGPLRLGLTPSEVANILDPIARIERSVPESGGFVREFRGVHMPILNFKDGKLFLVDTHVGIDDVTLFGHDVYRSSSQDIIKLLADKNGGVKRYFDFVVFDKLGINTEAFFSPKSDTFFDPADGLQDDRGLAIYQLDASMELPGLEPLKIPGL